MTAPKSLFAANTTADDILSRDACEAIAKRALGFATASETRVTITSVARGDTRFAVNQVSTSGTDVNTVITIRSSVGTRSASVSINTTDDASLAAAVKNAETLARLSPEDPEYVSGLGPQTYADTASHGMTALPSPGDRVGAVKAVVTRSRKAGLIATGYIETQVEATAIVNSRGLFGYQVTGGSSITTTVRTPDGMGSGWACAEANTWGELDAAAVGAHATEKAAKSRHPVPIEPGRWMVVLEPTAVGNLVQLIVDAADAREADEGRSPFSKKGGGNQIGTKIVSDQVTLVSDPADVPGMLFADDGLPVQRTTWIEKGVLRTLDYDRYWAQKTGQQPTAAPSSTLRLTGGSSSLNALIASTELGLLITRFFYIRSVDPRTLLYTGLTRDGTFLIENGKVTHAAKNLRFNDSPIFMLNNLEKMGAPVRVNADEDSSIGSTFLMPPIKCRDFTFTSMSDAI